MNKQVGRKRASSGSVYLKSRLDWKARLKGNVEIRLRPGMRWEG